METLEEVREAFTRRSCHVICAFSPKETDQPKQHFTYFMHKRILGALERWLSRKRLGSQCEIEFLETVRHHCRTLEDYMLKIKAAEMPLISE